MPCRRWAFGPAIAAAAGRTMVAKPIEGVKAMMSHGYGMGIGWFLIIVAFALPALLLAAGLLVAQFQRGPRSEPGATTPPEREAERVLAERLARGEIGAEEFEQRVRALRAAWR